MQGEELLRSRIADLLIAPELAGIDMRDWRAYDAAVEQGYSFLAGLADLRDVTYVDLPTSHWPMWSRPNDLAELRALVEIEDRR